MDLRLFARRMVICQIGFAALMIGGGTPLLMHLRATDLAQAEAELRGTSMLLAEQAERAFAATDMVEDLMIKRILREGVRTPDQFRTRMAQDDAYYMLSQRVGALAHLQALNAIDAEGHLVASSRTAKFDPVSVADREYFIALKADPTLAMVISRPVANRSTKAWTFYLAKQARAPDGTFLGLLIGAMDLEYFEGLYRNVVNGPDQAVSMFRTDSVLMVRYPHADMLMGETITQQGLAFSQGKNPATAVVVRKISVIDGQEKLIAATPLRGYPIVINAMDSIASILAPWRVEASMIIGGAATIEACAIALGIMMLRSIREQSALAKARADILVSLEREQAAEQLTHMAHHDALTGLANRVLFHNHVAQAVDYGRRGQAGALLYLDLDKFKIVNDTLGHPIGDALLLAVAERLRAETRLIDFCARLGGDEFGVVQTDIADATEASSLAARLIATISAPYRIHGFEVEIGASVGIAMIPSDGQDADSLMKAADLALYRSKENGRGRYSFFSPEMNAEMQQRWLDEAYLRDALKCGQFEMYYQPLMNIQDRTVTGFEALVRWNHPMQGLLQPGNFIPFAEEIGLIIPLGRWVLSQACRDAANWPGSTKVAVNVSVLQFTGNHLVQDVTEALVQSGLAASRLELEITETVMLHDTDAILAVLEALRDLGVGIAMDDFGTGYSSLSYLRRFPFSKVKIDRSFIADLGKSNDCLAIIAAVTGLCEVLGMTTLAEGVETEEQFQQLRSGNCQEAQGYLFSQARPASEVPAMLAEMVRRRAALKVAAR